MGGYFCVYSKISGLYLQRLVEFLKNSFECKIFKEDCQKNAILSYLTIFSYETLSLPQKPLSPL